ncbi:hypothetical protein PENANT_c031G10528 [Penicillium antarcticum]|uniref:Uncharacterized protein n=1 Tax=Penicillium antarcticum TaxID=416450 RepID=A0A1V6PV57_9EURO|nr:uncharacterized protein N7508_005501 [Penicillium antarcticum]KAJ5306486.1 hypothetical protein N7508_005501 [Penicillium antarcticum]OQD80919.1 hypothetical protein PENANT_c031G10528 [Penicillium antarcticum]
MECLHSRIPYAKWRLHAFQQLLASSRLPATAHATKRSISTTPRRQNKSAHDAPAFERTNINNATSDTLPPSKRLPQSPLITHPRPGPEKNRKRRPTMHETDQLSKNPWAVALASPIRMCGVTGARLPTALLGKWGLVQQQETEQLHFMPVGLMQDLLQNNRPPNSNHSDILATVDVKGQQSELDVSSENKSPTVDTPSPLVQQNNKQGRQLLLRITELLPLLRSISAPLSRKSGKKPAVLKLLPFRWKHPQGPIKASEEQKLNWMSNAPDIVLQSMRNVVYRKLDAASTKFKRLGKPNGVWRAVDLHEYSESAVEDALGCLKPFERMECGGLLLLGSNADGLASQSSVPCPDSVTLPQTESKVPVFDLSSLLSESDLIQLRESHPQFQRTALFFRPDEEVTIDAMIYLWKLKRLLVKLDLEE